MSYSLPRPARQYLRLVLLYLALWLQPSSAATPYQPIYGDPLLEPWRWRTFPELNGLGAQCITEGADGTLWFGMPDGAWSYDGVQWVHHSTKETAIGRVVTMCSGLDGSIYAGGPSGINRCSGGTWSQMIPSGGKRFAEVRKLIVAKDGSLWAATSSGALRFRQSTWTLYTDSKTAARQEIRQAQPSIQFELLPETVLNKPRSSSLPASRRDLADICEDQHGRIWLGTQGGEVLSFIPTAPASAAGFVPDSSETWAIYNESDGLICGRAPSILPLRDGTVWVVYGALSGYANVFDGSVWKTTRLADAGLPDDGGHLIQTRDGVVWLSASYVLCAYRDGRWRTYQKPEVPIPSTRNFLLQSSDGALWIGGSGTEIQRVDYQTSRWLTLQDLNFQWESPAAARWFLHRSGRVVLHEGQEWTSFGVEEGVIDSPVALVGARDGNVWVAGSHDNTAATARFDGHKWTRFIHEEFSWGVDWRAVFASSDGSVWFGAAVDSSGPPHHRDGILQFRDGAWIHHHQPGQAPQNGDDETLATLLPATQRPEPIGKFLCLGESRDGKIWAGRNVLAFHDGSRWSSFSLPEDLRLGVIETIFTTSQRDLWIGTRQFGAVRYDGHAWRQFQGKDSLVANSVRSITQTADGSIWAGTDRSFSRFDGFTWTADVLPAPLNIPHEGGSLKSAASGDVWINRFAPDWNRRAWSKTRPIDTATCEFWTRSHQPREKPPETTITAGAEDISQPGNLSVLWSGTVPWREPKESLLEYSFRLDEQAWSAFTTESGHAFFNLASGRHHVYVRARDRDFNVDPTPATLSFVVLPPVWRQGWFIGLMVLLTGVVAAQSIRVFLERGRLRVANRELAAEIDVRERAERQLQSLNLQLDERVKARTAQLESANKELETFSYTVSHDLRAPLRGIDGFSRALLEDYAAKLDEEGKEYIQRVCAGVQRMSRLIDDILSLSRISRSEMRLGKVNLSSIAREIIEELAGRDADRKVTVTIAPEVVVMGDARFLHVALENLLRNSWKFTEA